jgi:hypothetical protein
LILILLVEHQPESLDSLADFIECNTYVNNFNCYFEREFSKELAFNNNIISIQDNHPLSKYYIARNIDLREIIFHFSHKKISQVGSFDVNFQFQ